MGADMTELVRTIATSLAEKPEAIEVSSFSKGRTNYVRLKVDPEDMGRVIGRDGRVATAVRALLAAAADGERWRLEIVD